jgi:hypothetical protein
MRGDADLPILPRQALHHIAADKTGTAEDSCDFLHAKTPGTFSPACIWPYRIAAKSKFCRQVG